MSQPNTVESYTHLLNMEDEEFEITFGTETMEPNPSTDDVQDLNKDDGDSSGQRKRYRRYTEYQVRKLEDFFIDYPNPDEKQRKELGQELGLKLSQVRFWFQNRRTRVKTRHERRENGFLKAENERLRTENMRYREAFDTSTCPYCGGLATLDERHRQKIKNARLRGELGQFPAESSSVRGMNEKTIPMGSVPMPPVEEGMMYHHQAGDIDDELVAMINQFDVDEAPGL